MSKNVISFSLWGDNPKYTIGAVENAELAKDIYPDWICRFYYDLSVPESIIQKLKSLDAELILKNDTIGYVGLFWRFEVAFDDTVDRFIIRDTDSRLNLREKYAVDEWIESNIPFHIIRDHPTGHLIPILGGTWGATKNFIPEFKQLFITWIKHLQYNNHVRGQFFDTDQEFLNHLIWPLIKNNHLAHDPYFNISNNKRDLTYNNNGLYVGQAYSIIDGISVPNKD